ncbi:hypothetical protein AgCh_036055 [Apium graveolens]
MSRSTCVSFILLVLISATPLISSTNLSKKEAEKNEKVVIALYYETLCPYCSNLIVNYLYKYFEDGLDSISILKLVPYGNAKIKPNNTIVCQHGAMECVLNTVESCAIHTWPDVKDHFPFIYCVESLVYEDNYDQWETCFAKLNLDPKPVMDCYGSGYGKKLELQYAAETDALEPRHTYVPWLVVDGQPLYDVSVTCLVKSIFKKCISLFLINCQIIIMYAADVFYRSQNFKICQS